jgi:hypothetical protein
MSWVEHVACMEGKRNIYRVLAQKPEGKRPLETARHGWRNNINAILKQPGWIGNNWNQMVQDGHKC